MFETIKDLLFILLAAAGLIYIWKMILIFLLRNKTNKFIYVVVTIDNTMECVEQVLRSAAERTILMGGSKWSRVVCVDYGCNSESREIAQRLCDEYSFLDYMDSETFNKIFVSKTKATAN